MVCSVFYVIRSTSSYMLKYDTREHIGNLEHEILVLLKSQTCRATASNGVCLWASLSYISSGILLLGMYSR